MSKQDVIIMDAVVTEALGNSNFRCKLPNDMIVTCGLSGKMRMNYIRIIAGDKVEIEMSPYDLTKGRIVYRK